MKRLAPLWGVILVVALLVGGWATMPTSAQDDVVETVSAMQTRIARQQTQIADLQTRVAVLQTAVAGLRPSANAGAPTEASGATGTQGAVLQLTGTGTKTTQKFSVAGNWDLQWSYDCSNFGMQGNFQVFVYNGDGSLSFENGLVNQLGESAADVEHYHHGGTYYLVINSVCNWQITVKE